MVFVPKVPPPRRTAAASPEANRRLFTPKRSHFVGMSRHFAHGALVVAIVMVVALANRVGSLRSALAEAKRQQLALKVGDYVPPVPVTAEIGEGPQLGQPRGDDRQLVFAYSHTCAHCVASAPKWAEIVARLRSRTDVQVMAVSIDPPLQEGGLSAKWDAPVVDLSSRRLRSLYHLRVVPQVFVIDSSGLVTYVRVGRMESGGAADSVIDAVLGRWSRPSSKGAGPDQ